MLGMQVLPFVVLSVLLRHDDCRAFSVQGPQNAGSSHSQRNILLPEFRMSLDNELDNLDLEELRMRLVWIDAIEQRNEGQIDSFIDEEDQWNSMEEEERQLLGSKEFIIGRIEYIEAEEA
jgi:hypothetical protein